MKKVLALLLTLSLVVSTLPAAVYAATADVLGSAVTSEEAEPQEPERNTENEEPTEEEPADASTSSEEKPTEEEPDEEPEQDAPTTAEPQATPEEDASPVTQEVTTTKRIKVFSETKYPLTEGVVESKIYMRNSSNNNIKGHMITIQPNSDVTFKASYTGYYKSGNTAADRKKIADGWSGDNWGMATVMNQAKAYEAASDTQKPVIAAINGDYFNMSTGQPLGYLIMEGNRNVGTTNEPYFAVLKDGSYTIRDAGADTSDVQEAISGPFYLVKDGEITVPEDGGLIPVQSVGLTEQGEVILFEADGRQNDSVGMTVYEQAELLKEAGCVNALYLDGGGSATVCTRREGTDTLKVQNSPSDGIERTVSSALLLVSTGNSDNQFHHASISPVDDVYTPGSEVEFTAIGSDKRGGKADLPEGLTWALSQDSAHYGVIDAQTGVYTDNGEETETHEVAVELRQGDQVVGSSKITIAAPDELSFINDAVNLDYEARSDLGLSVFYQGRPVQYKAGDLVWNIADERAGKMDGNIFVAAANNEAGNLTVKCEVKVTSKWNADVTNSIQVGIGTRPVVVMDGGDGDGLDYNNIGYVHAAANGGGLVYETHEDDHGDVIVVHYENRGAIGSAEVCGVDNGKVRFGEKALRLNYDFRNITGIEGACLGFAKDIKIDGSPTAVGVWVYAPEGTPNLWLRLRCRDGNGTIQTKNFTPKSDEVKDGTKGGINWIGWKYLECDLTDVIGPITLIAGETFRVMDTNGGQGDMGTWVCTKDDAGNVSEAKYVGHSAGHLFVDNLQFVYGNNPADIDNPVISTIKGGSSQGKQVEIAADGSTVFDSNTLNFASEFYDVQNKRTSGLEFAYCYLDGVNMKDSDQFATDLNDGRFQLNGVKLANGTHSIRVLVQDKYGNEANVTRTFTVKGDNAGLTSVDLEPGAKSAPLGTEYDLKLTSNAVDDVKQVDAQIEVGTNCPVKAVTFSEGYTGTYDYNEKTGAITLQAERSESATSKGEGTLATITVQVPTSLPDPSYVTYQVVNGSVTYVNQKEGAVLNTFATSKASVPVTAAYELTTSVMIVGAESGTITVTDAKGNPVGGVEVYQVGETDTKLGETDEKGTLTVSQFCESVQAFTLYAKGEAGYSFRYTSQSLTPQGEESGAPYHILNNASKDPSTSQNLSWLSHPLKSQDKAVAQYAVKSAYDEKGEDAFLTCEGKRTVKDFVGSSDIAENDTVAINSVLITGLKADTEYAYRVGDGKNWSEVKTFTTKSVSTAETRDHTKFFVLGDTQAEGDDLSNLKKIVKQVGDGYSFGIQVGDSVESTQVYQCWDDILSVFDSFGKAELLHVIGNHETFADPQAERANLIYNTPNDKHYSVTYGNVYVATIAFTDSEAEMKEAAQWLIQDAKASKATWKVLTMHQPPYYTNTTESSNKMVNKVLPPAAEEAGIDFVFSGHDHSYARTYPLWKGDLAKGVDESSDTYCGDGVVYYICGSTGETKYGVTNNPDFHFAKADQNFKGSYIYLTVEADDESFTVTTHQGDEVVDTYTKTTACAGGKHSYNSSEPTGTYDNGYIYCDQCGKGVKATAIGVNGYNGFIQDKTTGAEMFFVDGVYQTGLLSIGEETMLFDKNGLAATGDVQIVNVKYQFKNGHYTGCSDKKAGDITFGFCGADADTRNLVFAYQKGNHILNVGLNPTQENPSGRMKDWTSFNYVPWQLYRYEIETIHVGEGVVNLGSCFARTPVKPKAGPLQDAKPQLKTVTLPSTLTTIGSGAFYHATALTDIQIPDGVTTIGSKAFEWCSALTELDIPAGVTSVGTQAFKRNGKNTIRFLGKTVPKFGDNIFYQTSKKCKLVVPCQKAWVSAVENLAFPGTVSYTDHQKAKAVKTVQPTAKAKGYQLINCSVCGTEKEKVEFTLAKGKKFTSGSLIYQVNKKDQSVTVTKATKKTLTTVSVPDTVTFGGVKYKVTVIGKSAFQSNTKLKKVTLGKYVTTISDFAFYKCYKLQKVICTKGITTVGKGAFNSDKALVSISTLQNVVSVGDSAFYKCYKLNRIGGTKNRVSLYDVKTIGSKAFQGCTAMTSFYEGGALEKVGANCFYGAKRLKTITFKTTKLTKSSVGKDAFRGIYGKAKIQVPSSKLKAYKTILKGKGQGKKVTIVKL